jgi:hypothetical protein
MAKLLEHLMQNGRALRDAPLVFVAVLVIAFSLAYWIAALRYEGIIDTLRAQLPATQTSSKSSPARNPDGVYQFGMQVGQVRSAQVDESRGLVAFGAIVGAMTLNTDRDFEYRDFVLRLKSYSGEGQVRMRGQATARTLNQVICEIVGRVSRQ